jgi:hypothetical protein
MGRVIAHCAVQSLEAMAGSECQPNQEEAMSQEVYSVIAVFFFVVVIGWWYLIVVLTSIKDAIIAHGKILTGINATLERLRRSHIL